MSYEGVSNEREGRRKETDVVLYCRGCCDWPRPLGTRILLLVVPASDCPVHTVDGRRKTRETTSCLLSLAPFHPSSIPALAAEMAHASTSTATPALHSAWNPYSVLAPSTRRKVTIISLPSSSLADARRLQHTGTAELLSERPLNSTLSIPQAVAEERLAGKYLQLDAPVGKMSDQRKKVLAVREEERRKKLASRNCGLVGRRRRTKGDMEKEVRFV